MTRSWNDHVGFTFCEGTQGSFLGVDEIVNCLSSCVLLGVGIRGGLRQGIDNFTCLYINKSCIYPHIWFNG